MNVQEYYLIKYAAEKEKEKGKGSGSILNKLLEGNPAEKSLELGASKNKPEGRIWRILKWLPGVAPGKKLYDEYNDTKTSWNTLSKELGKDKEGKGLLDRLGKLRDLDIGNPLTNQVGSGRTKVVRYGLPALAGIGGAAYGVAKSMRKNKQEQKEYDDLVNSEGFKQLPPKIQQAILDHGYREQNRGFFSRMARNAKYGLGYGLGAQAIATPTAWTASWIPYLQNRYANRVHYDYDNRAKAFQSDLAKYLNKK